MPERMIRSTARGPSPWPMLPQTPVLVQTTQFLRRAGSRR